ncbi:MAG: MATE family efflux transporter [Bacteroidales bacterium]|nr:MATE family efflux transporter [Bacteroidales bacterium]
MKDLTIGKEGPLILKFAIPMLIGNVFQQLYNVVDSIIIGQYVGKESLAAVGAAFPLIFVLISFVIGIGIGFSIVLSQYFGAKDMEKVERTIDTMWNFLFVASLVVGIVGIVFCKSILELTGLPEDVLPLATTYLRVYLSGTVLFFGFNGMTAILRGLGDSKTPLYFLIIATVINIALDLLFVLVFGWGITGVAAATVIAQGGAFFSMVFYINRTHSLISLRIRKMIFDRVIFKKCLNIGLPTGFQQTFVSLGMIALYSIINGFGTDVVAAFAAAGRLDSFALLPAMNFGAALSTFTGQNMGANKPERVRKGMVETLKMTSIISIVVSLIFYFFGDTLMSAFTPDSNIIAIGTEYLIIVSSFYISFSAMFTFNGVMRGAGDTLIPMFITLLSLWLIRIPVSFGLSKVMGVPGIWWGIPIAWVFGAIASYAYYKTGRWKKKVVVKRTA